MKKLSLLVGGMILSGAVMAQKPAADVPMTLEGILGFNHSANGLQFAAPAIRFRYFFTDNIAGRLTFGIANTMNKYNSYENADFTGATGEYKVTNNTWNAAIGGEYHFAGTDRLSPFVALNIMFGGGGMHTEGTNASMPLNAIPGTANQYATYQPNSYHEKSDAKMSMFGVGLSGGVDYYFAENFYAGLELGIMWSTMHQGQITNETTDAAGVTTSATIPGTNSSMSIATGAMPAVSPTGNIRLGWRF